MGICRIIHITGNDFRKTLPQDCLLNTDLINYKEIEVKLSQKFADPSYLKIKSALNQLSKEQSSYLERLNKILQNKKEADSVMVFESVARLENEIWKSDLPENEKIIILTATAVGKYSWKFWADEHHINSKGPQTLREAVIEGDISGAIAGMIGGCIGGAVVGTLIMPGVGSLTACMLEAVNLGFQGAVIGSTISAIKYLLFD